MMEDNNESSRRNFAGQLEKYTLAEKQKLRECVEMVKKNTTLKWNVSKERLDTMPNAKS